MTRRCMQNEMITRSGDSNVKDNDSNRDILTSDEVISYNNIPNEWVPMADENILTKEDENNGLKDFLYEVRNSAADAVSNLFTSLGIEKEQFKYMYEMPVGLEEESDMTGMYYPGIYGIVLGRNSEDIKEFLNGNEETRKKLQKRMTATMVHEMIHSFQTVPSNILEGGFDTVGNTTKGWVGLEEGMTEALSAIAVKMQINNWGLKETAQNLEEVCTKRDMPATQMAARLIRKMKPQLLKWYLTSGINNDASSNNEIEKAFGASNSTFCKNMELLYEHEQYDNLSENTKERLVEQTMHLIDEATIE